MCEPRSEPPRLDRVRPAVAAAVTQHGGRRSKTPPAAQPSGRFNRGARFGPAVPFCSLTPHVWKPGLPTPGKNAGQALGLFPPRADGSSRLFQARLGDVVVVLLNAVRNPGSLQGAPRLGSGGRKAGPDRGRQPWESSLFCSDGSMNPLTWPSCGCSSLKVGCGRVRGVEPPARCPTPKLGVGGWSSQRRSRCHPAPVAGSCVGSLGPPRPSASCALWLLSGLQKHPCDGFSSGNSPSETSVGRPRVLPS